MLFSLKCHDTYKIYGIYNENYIYINVPIDNSDTLANGDYIKINKNKYDYKINYISEMKVVENINYQEYIISINECFRQNEVVDITFYYNEEKLIKKIYNVIF